jgi:hypothetical protein
MQSRTRNSRRGSRRGAMGTVKDASQRQHASHARTCNICTSRSRETGTIEKNWFHSTSLPPRQSPLRARNPETCHLSIHRYRYGHLELSRHGSSSGQTGSARAHTQRERERDRGYNNLARYSRTTTTRGVAHSLSQGTTCPLSGAIMLSGPAQIQ